MLKKVVMVLLLVVASMGFVFLAGCENNAQTGAAVGGLGGAAVGALAGGRHHAGEGALIGGAVGAGGGYMIGNESDKAQTNQQMQAIQQEANTIVVNITNSNGSVTPVTLRRSGNVWVGPRGEEYMSVPTPEQLRPAYGLDAQPSAPMVTAPATPPPAPMAAAPAPPPPAPMVVAPAPVYVPEYYVWDGYEYVGWCGGQYVYWSPGSWVICDRIMLGRFHRWERFHPNWRREAIRYHGHNPR